MIRVELDEWERRSGVELTADTAAALQGTRMVNVSPSTTVPDAWDLRAAQYVGVIDVGEVELWIRPKVGVSRLLDLLLYGRQDRWRDRIAGFDVENDLVAAIAVAFAQRTDAALARGILQGYVRVEDALPTLKGRLRTGAQIQRRFGFPVPAEVVFDDYTTDIVENRILRAAADRLLRLPRVPARAVPTLRRAMVKLNGVTGLTAGVVPDFPLITRLNRRYEPALRLGHLVLRGASIRFSTGTVDAVGFCFNMNTVFEDFVSAVLQDELQRYGGRVRLQWSDQLDEAGRIVIRPDITWWSGTRCIAAADAKYKSLEIADLPNADVYQVAAYCTAFGLDTGHLIYAAGNEAPARHRLRTSGTEILVHALDLAAPLAAVHAQLARIAAIIRRTVPARATRETATA